MRPTYHVLLLCLLIFACSDDMDSSIDMVNEDSTSQEENLDNSDDTVTETEEESINNPIRTDLRTFIFGHSLINHELQVNVTPSQETSVPHWMFQLAQESGYSYNASGQYGFLPQHANLPPISQWGFDLFPGVWESDNQSFADADFNSVLITAGNFVQWQPATTNYYNETISPVGATLEILDWLNTQEPGLAIYLYENWPDMAPYIQSFPPNSDEVMDYHDYTTGDFHEWWLNYHDEIMAARPDLNVRMIPVGPILAKILTETALNEVPITEFYEDDAPHGRATLYFLASMITYMAMYGAEVPSTYRAPEIIHESINQNYDQITSIIWSELEAFNNPEGQSRVW